MTTYMVTATRSVYQVATVDVDAGDEEEALGRVKIMDRDDGLEWNEEDIIDEEYTARCC